MGRGLSNLQKTILRMALSNRIAEGLGPIIYGVEFENQARDHPVESPEYLAWVATLSELGCLDATPRTLEWVRQMSREAGEIPELPAHCERGIITLLGRYDGRVAQAPLKTASKGEADSLVAAIEGRGIRARVRMEMIDHADIFLWEVLASVYGFSEHRKRLRGEGTAIHHRRDPGNATKRFAKSEIGVGRYTAARVATSKAFSRLDDRGLAAVFHWGNSPGIKLTEEGVEESLSATSRDSVTTGSR